MRKLSSYFKEQFSNEERVVLSKFFTNVDGPVFALKNLPEVVKGALFARYSRSSKSLRRLFLDEFISGWDYNPEAVELKDVGLLKASDLYQRIFYDYGDDSVSQLGGAHIACEQASNILTKVLERGRLASYLEQSTRYIYFDRQLGGRYRYMTPPEIEGTSAEGPFVATMDSLFRLYSTLAAKLETEFARRFPVDGNISSVVRKQTLRAKVCDELRGLLPACTISNVGIFASGQAFEALLLRMRAHPLQEVQDYSALLLHEVRQVLPDFVRRIDIHDRGVAWSAYLQATASAVARLAHEISNREPNLVEPVTLVDWDPEGELKIIANALYGASNLPDDYLLNLVRQMSPEQRERIFWAYIGERGNRRHRPGRALERTSYRFDIVSDYGAFRDLQRHRMLTIEWQRLTPDLGYKVPEIIEELKWRHKWDAVMEDAAKLYDQLEAGFGAEVAQYALPFSYNLRFYLQFNAREAFHLLELRSQKGGHDSYRSICLEMHRKIEQVAGHKLVSSAMKFVDYQDYDFGRLESERKAEIRRGGASAL